MVGDQNNPQNYEDNPECKGGLLTDGGWLDCGLTGRYLVVTSEDSFPFEFIEVLKHFHESVLQNIICIIVI